MKISRILAAMEGCLMALVYTGPVMAQTRLVVGVCDRADVPDRIMDRVLADAHLIFERAGISTEWVDRQKQPDTAVMVNVRILPGESRNPNAPDAFGSAWLPGKGELGNLADVYYGHVTERAWTDAGIARLLASVMAHEVGHLLGAKHSAAGIMQGRWGYMEYKMIQFGALRFVHGESAQLQNGVEAQAKELRAGSMVTDVTR